WVDGREKKCQVPEGAANAAESESSSAAVPASVATALKSMEERIGQLMQMIDANAASTHQFMLTLGMMVAMGILTYIGYNVYSAWMNENKPPTLQGFAPVPVQIGDKTVLLGVGIVKWEVPPSLNAAMVQV